MRQSSGACARPPRTVTVPISPQPQFRGVPRWWSRTEAAQLAGWAITGQHVDGGALLVSIEAPAPVSAAGLEVLGTYNTRELTFHPVPGGANASPVADEGARTCTVCGTRRARTHVIYRDLRHGGIGAAGLDCLEREFSPTRNSHLRKWVAAVLEDPESAMASLVQRVHSSIHYPVEYVLAAAIVAGQEPGGYMSRARADRHGLTPTSERMRMLLDSRPEEVEARLLEGEMLRLWVSADCTDTTEFGDAMRAAVELGEVPQVLLGLFAAMPAAQHRELQGVRSGVGSREPFVSEHLGAVGDRMTLPEVVVTSLRLLDTGSTLVEMRDPDAHKIVWFASRLPSDLREGDRVALTGTVAGHEIFRDTYSTRMSRCRFG